jgi:hypothetical protein
MRSIISALFLLLCSFFTHAQGNVTNQLPDSKVISGSFDLDKGTEHINIVYTLYPNSSNQYVLELATANPLALSAVIMDKESNKVSELKPAEISHFYTHAFDANLSGNYTIYVKHNGQLIKTIATKND